MTSESFKQALSLGQYISISIKCSSVTYFIEIWSHDRHLITWRHTRTYLRLGHIHNKCDKTSETINGYLLKKGYQTWFYTKYSLFTITNNIFGHFVDWQLACEDVNKVWSFGVIRISPVIGLPIDNRVMQDTLFNVAIYFTGCFVKSKWSKMPSDQITYSEKYTDDHYEYR